MTSGSAISAENRAKLPVIAEALRKAGNVLLLAHKNVDGDCLGSTAALGLVLKSMGKSVYMHSCDQMPVNLKSIPGSEDISQKIPEGKFDAVILIECPQYSRIPSGLDPYAFSDTVINLDHHSVNNIPAAAELSIVEPHLAALAEMLPEVFEALGAKIDKDIAKALYIAISTDSGSLQYSSASPHTYRVMADLVEIIGDIGPVCRDIYAKMPGEIKIQSKVMERLKTSAEGRIAYSSMTDAMLSESGIDIQNTQNLVRDINCVRDTEIFAFFKCYDDAKVRISLRSAKIPVHKLAEKHGGGGHPQAAAFNYEEDKPCTDHEAYIARAVEAIIPELEELLANPPQICQETETIKEELMPGARNAIKVCLAVKRSDRVFILTDKRTLSVGQALRKAASEVGAECSMEVLEDHIERPASDMPDSIIEKLAHANIAIYCVYPQPNELPSRIKFVKAIDSHGIKYAHMVGITEEIMCQGMRADYRKVDDISRRLLALASKCRTIHVTSRAGTDLHATFEQRYRWRKTSGIIEEVWSNLPGGEIFTFPADVNGTFVVDGTVGDYFSGKYGVIARTPMTLEIEGGRLRKATCENKNLEKEFWDYCHSMEYSDRIGEFAIGTNLAVFEFTGNLLQDEKMPGIHIAFGDPYGSQTGADWSCMTHVDVITRSCNIMIDDELIMEHGIFVSEKLGIDYTYLYDDQSLLPIYSALPNLGSLTAIK